MKPPLIRPPLSLFQSRLDALAKTPSLDGRVRRNFQYQFPRLSLNPGNIDSRTLRIPGGVHFVVRQIVYSVTETSNPVTLGRARITTSSNRRENFQWMSDPLPLELFASASSRTPRYLSRPILIEPGTSCMLEVQNISASSHDYDVTLVGELVFDLPAADVEAFMNHAWYAFLVPITPIHADQTTISFELRNDPLADFYITHLASMRYGPSANAAVGPTKLRIEPSSQGDQMMADWIDMTLLVGSYYNLTAVPRGSIAPSPLPEPYLIQANGSINVSAVQPDNVAPSDMTLVLEGVKVFK